MYLGVEVRKSDRDLRIPLSIEAEPHTVAEVLGRILREQAGELIRDLEVDYEGRLDAVRFAIKITVDTSAITPRT